jgi:hypothetical protein
MSLPSQKKQSDLIFAAQFSFKPNKLQYCGPDKNKELFEYLQNSITDRGLEAIMKKFETLYPYLRLIAKSNKIDDPFNHKVVEAYWIGNELLENVQRSRLYYCLLDDLALRKKLPAKEISTICRKIPAGANAHHSFHVFNIWQRTGHIEHPHTLTTMDECRMGWGQVRAIEKKTAVVLYEPLIYKNHELALGEPTSKDIELDIKATAKIGDWVSFHWSSFCGVLTLTQLKNIINWTTLNLQLANQKND